MVALGASLLLLFLCQAFSLPTQLSKDDETVIKCISEILADTLSRSSPMPVTSDCMKVLREDDRTLTMLHHRHLLTELEDLAHQENTKHLLAHESNPSSREGKPQGELKKGGEPAPPEEAAPEKVEERAGEKKKEEKKEEEEEEMTKKEEKTQNPKEKTEVSQQEDLREALEARDEEEEEEEEEEKGEIKKRTSSETWQSKEYFGHAKKRGPGQPPTQKGKLQGDEDGQERQEVGKRRFGMDEEEEGDTSEEEEEQKYHHGGDRDDETWEEGERRSAMAKRVAEKASDEETAQFEEEKEEKGLQSSKPKAHLHQGWKPWQEEAGEEEEEEEKHNKARHGHRHPSLDLDLKKRHWKDLRGRHHAREEEEEEEEEEKDARQKKAPEVQKLEEIERELNWAADKLEELKRG